MVGERSEGSPGTSGPVGWGQEILDGVRHGYVGGLQSVAEHGSFQSGFLSGAVPMGAEFAFVNPSNIVLGTVEHLVIGGTASELGGGKFANGAVTGAFGYLFNQVLHSTTIEVDRFKQTDDSTIGRLTVNGTTIQGYTLEPPGPDSNEEGSDQRIPAGTYPLTPYSSDDHPDSYQLQGVEGRSLVLIHSGNYPEDTLGCLL